MHVVLFGATGMIGSRILQELVSRGHQAIAVVREPERVPPHPAVKATKGDLLHTEEIAPLMKGADAIISAYNPGMEHPETLVDATQSLIAAAKQAGVRRLLTISGTGTLFIAPGVRMVDDPGFSPYWRPTAQAHADALDLLMESGLDWTSISPPGLIQPGNRTGKYRIGTDYLVEDAHGHSRISSEDFAIAMVDELEHPKHIQKRFTVGY
ncbi:MAG TPA: NAD(P)H-binding protein [Granulicella sp.]